MPRNWSIHCCGATDATMKSYSQRCHWAQDNKVPSACSVSQTVRHPTYDGDGIGRAVPKEPLGDTSYSVLGARSFGMMQMHLTSPASNVRGKWVVTGHKGECGCSFQSYRYSPFTDRNRNLPHSLADFPQQTIPPCCRNISAPDVTTEVSLSWY